MKRIKLLDPSLIAGRDYLPAAEMREIEQASAIISEAENWAIEHRATAIREAEQERVAAFASAYADGLAEFVAATDVLEAETDKLSGRLLDLLRQCLSHTLAQTPSPQVLTASIEPVLRRIVPPQSLSFAVHPSRVADLEQALAHLSERQDLSMGLEVTTDSALSEQDCLLFSSSEVFDVGVTVMVDQLIQAVSGHLAKDDHELA